MIKGRKDWRGFYKSTRKEDLVYLANEFLSVVKLSSFCKILEISKSENIGKKGLKKHNKRGR
jgi:N-glycosylase/DNA lyase